MRRAIVADNHLPSCLGSGARRVRQSDSRPKDKIRCPTHIVANGPSEANDYWGMLTCLSSQSVCIFQKPGIKLVSFASVLGLPDSVLSKLCTAVRINFHNVIFCCPWLPYTNPPRSLERLQQSGQDSGAIICSRPLEKLQIPVMHIGATD
jgi:hypothetical protein